MSIGADYLGMELALDPLNQDNLHYFQFCSQHDFRLQRCEACGVLRFPPSPRCSACAHPHSIWAPVEPRGAVYTYTIVHQATNAAFKPYVPYAVLLVELDAQPDRPLRVPGNLVTDSGRFQGLEVFGPWGIGSRVRMRFADVGEGLSLPMWGLDTASS